MPQCTVITPVHNHWHLVPKLLQCLAAQTLPQHEFEMVLVENLSDDFHFPGKLPPNTRIELCTTPGSYAARNHGIEHANGDWLVFTDADCLPRPDWLETLMSRVSQVDDDTILAGAVEMIPQNDPPNRWEIYDLVKGIPQAWYVSRGYAATANLAASAVLVKKMKGFDGTRISGGDADFCRRATAAGARLKYLAEAVVEHPARASKQDIMAKTRRLKHAQLHSGTRGQRLKWRLRTFLPPVIAAWRFLTASRWPLRYRLSALATQLRLWPVEMRQALHMP